MIQTNLILEKTDILRIGYCIFEKNGLMAIKTSTRDSNIEEILLRSILKLFSDDYKIIETIYEEGIRDDQMYDMDVVFVTNFAWHEYTNEIHQALLNKTRHFIATLRNHRSEEEIAQDFEG